MKRSRENKRRYFTAEGTEDAEKTRRDEQNNNDWSCIGFHSNSSRFSLLCALCALRGENGFGF
jgi:hypothetical protein